MQGHVLTLVAATTIAACATPPRAATPEAPPSTKLPAATKSRKARKASLVDCPTGALAALAPGWKPEDDPGGWAPQLVACVQGAFVDGAGAVVYAAMQPPRGFTTELGGGLRRVVIDGKGAIAIERERSHCGDDSCDVTLEGAIDVDHDGVDEIVERGWVEYPVTTFLELFAIRSAKVVSLGPIGSDRSACRAKWDAESDGPGLHATTCDDEGNASEVHWRLKDGALVTGAPP